MNSHNAPRPGLIVEYTVRDGQRRGEHRAAIITRTHSQPPSKEVPALPVNYHVNLSVFPDQANPALHEERYAASAPYDADGKPGTWRYFADELPAQDAAPSEPASVAVHPDVVAAQAAAEAADDPPTGTKPAKPKK